MLTMTNTSDPEYPLDVALETRPIRELKEGEVLVRVAAAGFNRREVFTIFFFPLLDKFNHYPS